MAASAPPNWDQWGDICQAADNYHLKHLFRTAPITAYMIVEPTAAMDIPIPTSIRTDTAMSPVEDCNTVKKLDAKLLRMQGYWAESQSEPFPEGVRNAMISSNLLYAHIRLFPISRITLAHLRTQ